MRHLVIIILCCMSFLVCCTTKNSDSASSQIPTDEASLAQTLQNDTDSTPVIENRAEDFYDFIVKFHSDNNFKRQRISDVICGYNYEYDTAYYMTYNDNCIWDKDTVMAYLCLLDSLFNSEDYPFSIHRIDSNKYAEKFSIKKDSLYTPNYGAVFNLKDSVWIMNRFVISL